MKKHIKTSLVDAASVLSDLLQNEDAIENIENGAQALIAAFSGTGKVYSCGNGGSMCDAMHFAEELSGRYRLDRRGLPATAISDPSHMSCVSNDYGYEFVFSRYIEAHGQPGDVLLGISTSGTSKNIIAAAKTAQRKKMKVITLTGRPDSEVGNLADYDICTPAGKFADRVQELHIKTIHILIELVEREMFPNNYKDV